MKLTQVPQTLLLTSALVVWVIVTAAAVGLQNPADVALLGWALTGAIVVAALVRPFRGAAVASTLVSLIAFLVVQSVRMGVAAPFSALSVAVCFIVAGYLSTLVCRRISQLQTQLDVNATLIGELTRHDELTGALKGVYAASLLDEEIERARRYGRPLSVALIGPDDWSSIVRERGQQEAQDALKSIGQVLGKQLRQVDIVARYDESRFIVILPETPALGGQVVGERLCQAVATRANIRFRAGVAEFPTDALARDELIEEAEAAIKFAHNAGVVVASYGLVV